MAGKHWTKKEMELLEGLTSEFPPKAVAKKLGRSQDAVRQKRTRMGMGGFRDSTDMLTRNTLATMMGVENRTIEYWERRGLKRTHHKRPFIMYRQEDIFRFLENNLEIWNASRVTEDAMLIGFDWYRKKRRHDKPHTFKWSHAEVSQLNILRHEGYSIREIAQKMNRSESSIKYKLYRRKEA